MLKVGIIGVGHLGKYHVQNWKLIEAATIIGFYDTDAENATAVAKEFGIKQYKKVEDLIDACDAVDIVVPTNKHYELCLMAIKKGKHVFVEKPLTQTLEEAKVLVNLVKEADVKLQVGHVERFNPAYLAIKNNIAVKPMFIEVHRLAQFNPRGTEVSVILDLMIHDIDIILSMVQSSVKQIHASGVAVITDTPDIANVRIEFNNGCVANLTSSRISMKKMRKMRLFQKDAYVGIDFLEKKSEIIKIKGEEDVNAFAFDIETNAGTKTIAVASPVVNDDSAIKLELQSFVQSIQNNTTPVVSEIDGYLAMEVAHQILQKIGANTVKQS